MPCKFGIDLGGTKIEGAVFNENGAFITRRRMPTPAGSYPDIINALESMVRLLEEESKIKAVRVGIGIPGVETEDGIQNANTTSLNGKFLSRDLSARTGLEIITANDANCFTLSEAVDGAAAGARSVFGVITGTGCGGGLVISTDSRPGIISGFNLIGGEWGHNPLPWRDNSDIDPPDCWCGRADCLETHLSGAGLVRNYQYFSDNRQKPAGALEVCRAADGGDPAARRSIEQYNRVLARGLSSVINLFDPECIVLGGGLSNNTALHSGVTDIWNDYIFAARAVKTKLVVNRHGDSSGVRGAAWL